jgi:tetratricopeptide (TPR) repeat protein
MGVLPLIGLALLLHGPGSAAPQDPAARFAAGLQLIESNCTSCKNRSLEALTKGVGLIEEALDQGFPDRARAYAALGEGYAALADSVGEPKKTAYADKQIAAEQQALALDPGNRSVLGGLAAAGERLIDANCAECLHASRAGLMRGVELVQRALAGGLTPPNRAYRALGRGYNNLMAITKPGAERDGFIRMQREAFEKWVAIEPESAEALSWLAASIDDLPRAKELYQRILNRDPGNADARFQLGNLLFSEGKKSEGLEQMMRAWKTGELDDASVHSLASSLREVGREGDARAVEESLVKEREKLRRPPPH